MRRMVILNSDETVTLFMLAKLNDEILTEGLTRDNIEGLTELQYELIEIIRKFSR